MSDKKTLRIFCPVHEASFEAANAPKILCEITGHALSSNFPSAEFWEYCCTCDTFSPSRLDKGERARTVCFSCQNEISRYFICAHCKTVSFVSDKPAKGQTYFIPEQGIEPSCPGCGTSKQSRAMIRHDCSEAGAGFLTELETCPFCLEKTSEGFVLPTRPSVREETGACPNCHAINPPSAVFCGKCKYHLRPDIEVANPGSDISKTQALGSLCPNCSTPVRPGFPFCGECGQAVKMTGDFPLPPPPPPPNRTGRLANSFMADLDNGEEEAYQAEKLRSESTSITGKLGGPDAVTSILKEPAFKVIAFTVGGIILFAILIVAISSRTGGTDPSNNQSRNTTVNVTNTAANTARIGANTIANGPKAAVNSNNINSNIRPSNGGPLVGRTGTLGWDSALREFPQKDSVRLGVHYKGASFEVLDVAENIPNDEGGVSRWYQIKVVRYGKSVDPSNEGLGKDPGSGDIGWVNGITYVWKGPNRDRKVKEKIILLD